MAADHSPGLFFTLSTCLLRLTRPVVYCALSSHHLASDASPSSSSRPTCAAIREEHTRLSACPGLPCPGSPGPQATLPGGQRSADLARNWLCPLSAQASPCSVRDHTGNNSFLYGASLHTEPYIPHRVVTMFSLLIFNRCYLKAATTSF